MSLREDILAELESGIELQGLSLRERVTERRSSGVSALVGVCRKIGQSYGWYITLADMVDEGVLERRVEEAPLVTLAGTFLGEERSPRYFYKIAKKGN